MKRTSEKKLSRCHHSHQSVAKVLVSLCGGSTYVTFASLLPLATSTYNTASDVFGTIRCPPGIGTRKNGVGHIAPVEQFLPKHHTFIHNCLQFLLYIWLFVIPKDLGANAASEGRRMSRVFIKCEQPCEAFADDNAAGTLLVY